MRSDKIRDIPMNFDSIAAHRLMFPMAIPALRRAIQWKSPIASRLEGLPLTQIEVRETLLQVGPLELDLIETYGQRADARFD